MSCSKYIGCWLSRTLIETGSAKGDGIQYALNAGFQMVFSIEIDPAYYEHCVKRFQGNGRVILMQGDSKEILPEILAKTNEPVTILLDAHVTGPNQKHGEKLCPVIDELKAIIDHSKSDQGKNLRHIIVIDDINWLDGKQEWYGNISVKDIKNTLKDSGYEITEQTKRYCVIQRL